MLKNYTGSKKVFFLLALIIADALLMCDYVFSPTVSAIYDLFPDRTMAVNFVISGNTIVTLIASPLATALCSRYDIKKVLLIGGGIGVLANAALNFTMNLWAMCIIRMCSTVGYSFTTICVFAIINNLYDDPERTATISGYLTAGMAGAGSLIGILAGNLATVSIQNTYKAYWLFVVFLVFVAIWMPSIRITDSESKTEESGNAPAKNRFSTAFILTAAGVFIFHLIYITFVRFISVYTAENALGNEALTGYLNFVSLGSGVLASVLFGKLFKALRRKLLWLAYTAAVLGTLIMFLTPSVPTAFIGQFLIGIAYPIVFSFTMVVLPTMVTRDRRNDVVSIVTILETVATLACAYAMTGLKSLMHTDSFTSTMWIYVIVLAAFTLLSVFTLRALDTKKN